MERTTLKEKAIREAALEPALTGEVITTAPEEILGHFVSGKAHFEAGRYAEAIKEFETVLKTAPGNIETRIWVRKAKEELARPKTETTTVGEAKQKECVWMKLGIVSYRLCTKNYDCLTCEFDQMMQDQLTAGEAPELDGVMEKFKKLPGNQRICRYALKGYISYRLCTRLFQCEKCEFGQMIQDTIQQKLDKLAVRRKALTKKR